MIRAVLEANFQREKLETYRADIEHAALVCLSRGAYKGDAPSKVADETYHKRTDTRSADDIKSGLLKKLDRKGENE